MRPKLTVLIITIAGFVALFVIISSCKRGIYQKPEQLTLSLIKDKAFLKTVKFDNVRSHFPAGFITSRVTMSTVELETNLGANRSN